VCCPAAGIDIGDAGATALAAALQKNTTVTAVDLGGARARSGGRDGWRGSGDAWAHGRGPPCRRAQCAGREEREPLRGRPPRAALALASASGPARSRASYLCACFGLESCGADLGFESWVCCPAVGNNIGADGATALAAALQKNMTVTKVDLRGARACWGGRDGWRGWGTLGPTAAARRAGAPNGRGGREREPLRGRAPRAALALPAASGPPRFSCELPLCVLRLGIVWR
jgi:hypothetical protein